METLITSWSFVAVAFAAGCIVGGLLYWATSRGGRDAQKLKADLEAAEEEFEEYKSSVSEHFNKTSELVSELTQDYVKVYKHLADGAQLLGEAKGTVNLLEQQPAKALLSATDSGNSDAEKVASNGEASDATKHPESPSTVGKPHQPKQSKRVQTQVEVSPDQTVSRSDSKAATESVGDAGSPGKNKTIASKGADDSKAASVAAASREYISETLKQAADIADKIDRDIDQSFARDTDKKSRNPENNHSVEDASVPTLSNIAVEPTPVYGPPVPQTIPAHGRSTLPPSEKRESV